MSIRHLAESLLKKKAILVAVLSVSIILNVYYFSRSNKSERVARNYYLNCVNQAQNHIANADRMLGYEFKLPGANGLLDNDYEKYYLLANEFKELGDDIALFNIYFTHIEKSNNAYFGRIQTSQIFDCYKDMIIDWAFAVKNNNSKEMPTKVEIQALRADIKALTKIFQVYCNVDYRDEEKMDSMNYGKLDNRLKKLYKSSKLEKIRIYGKMYLIYQ